MTKKFEIYRCETCGNTMEITRAGAGKPVCCGREASLAAEKSAEASLEKHVPLIEAIEHGIRVTVGSTPHPMAEKHFIEWIEVINGDYIQRKYLHPGELPVAEFYVPYSKTLIAREYCNVHGLWTTKQQHGGDND